jgi:hypothetical protein
MAELSKACQHDIFRHRVQFEVAIQFSQEILFSFFAFPLAGVDPNCS